MKSLKVLVGNSYTLDKNQYTGKGMLEQLKDETGQTSFVSSAGENSIAFSYDNFESVFVMNPNLTKPVKLIKNVSKIQDKNGKISVFEGISFSKANFLKFTNEIFKIPNLGDDDHIIVAPKEDLQQSIDNKLTENVLQTQTLLQQIQLSRNMIQRLRIESTVNNPEENNKTLKV